MNHEPTIDLVVWDHDVGAEAWELGRTHRLPVDVSGARARLDEVLRETAAEWLLFWDPTLGRPDPNLVGELTLGRADAYHAGLTLGMGGLLDDVDLVQPIWYFAVDPEPDVQAVCWRVSMRALLVRTATIRALGHLDPAYSSLEAAGLDLGFRMLTRGAVIVHERRLVNGRARAEPVRVEAFDRYVFCLRHVSRKWVRYVVARRALRTLTPHREIQAHVRARRATSASEAPGDNRAVYERRNESPAASTDGRTVSVVLPTLGRYELLRDVLDDLRRQTVVPAEIICVDQNDAAKRRPDLYAEFADLPLEVVFQDGKGQWLARNTALERARGKLLLFLDDDSRIEPDFVEQHIDALYRYRADVSAGASRSVVGAPVPDNYAFFRVSDAFDSGNALVRREALERLGCFDQRYDRMRSGDAEFGLRLLRSGGLIIHHPHAYRAHLKEAEGGLRTFGSWDNFRQNGFLTPRPLPSVVVYLLTYFSARQRREALLLGLASSVVPYHRKRRASPREWAGYVTRELPLLPLSLIRLARALRMGRRLHDEGPRIPQLAPASAKHPL